jgi:hypothetical protein
MNLLVTLCNKYFFNWIESFTNGLNWKFKTTFLLVGLSFIFSTGALFYLPTAFKAENWESYRFKKENLFKQPPFNPVSHASKKTFRLTMPIISKVFHFNNWATVAFLWIINFLFLYQFLRYFYKLLGNKTIAFLATFGITFVYIGHAGFTDINTWFDGIAYFFILISIVSNSPIIILSSVLLAAFTDERAFLSAVVVLFYHLMQDWGNAESKNVSSFRNSISVLFGIILSLVIRLYLEYKFDIHLQTGGSTLEKFLADTPFWGMAIWTFLEGYWLLVVLLFLSFIHEKKYLNVFVLMITLAVFTLTSFLVFDKTRSGAYIFPLIFLAVKYLKVKMSIEEWKFLFLAIAIVCFLFPAYYIISDTRPYTLWYKPIFIRLIDLMNHMGVIS